MVSQLNLNVYCVIVYIRRTGVPYDSAFLLAFVLSFMSANTHA